MILKGVEASSLESTDDELTNRVKECLVRFYLVRIRAPSEEDGTEEGEFFKFGS
jgi:hypothetical protein